MSLFLNIYPWLFFYLPMFAQTAQAHQIYKTKKTKGLSIITFLIMLLASTAFGWTYFLGGQHSFPLLLGNGLSIMVLTYTLFYILKNKNIKFKYIITIFIFLNGILLLILGTVNYAFFLINKIPMLKLVNIPTWFFSIMPIIGGIASAVLFFPQLIKILKFKKTRNLNYFLMIFFGIYMLNVIIFWILFIIYWNNWSLAAPPIIFCLIRLIIQITIIILKYKYEKVSRFKENA